MIKSINMSALDKLAATVEPGRYESWVIYKLFKEHFDEGFTIFKGEGSFSNQDFNHVLMLLGWTKTQRKPMGYYVTVPDKSVVK